MRIVTIFAGKLFACHYDNEEDDELRRLLLLWNDPFYLYQFFILNQKDVPKNKSVDFLVNQIIDNANEIDDMLYEIILNEQRDLGEFFKPLRNSEYRIVELSKQKGRNNYLRIYALKIDVNCYVITGGAIKFTHLMQNSPHTAIELTKIEKCRDFLEENDVRDADSFYEFLNDRL